MVLYWWILVIISVLIQITTNVAWTWVQLVQAQAAASHKSGTTMWLDNVKAFFRWTSSGKSRANLDSGADKAGKIFAPSASQRLPYFVF